MKASSTRLDEAEALLRLAEAGLKQVTGGNAERRVPGLRNVLVFGKLFTASMKALASGDPLFASWFDQQQLPEGVDALRKDALREPKTRVEFTQVQLASAGEQFGPRPANARAFFSGDRLGGAGWDITLPNGKVEKFYVTLPEDVRVGDAFGAGAMSAEAVSRRYVTSLREMLRHAKIAVR